jgi:hypothetical protein
VGDVTATGGFVKVAILPRLGVGRTCGIDTPDTFVFTPTIGGTYELRVVESSDSARGNA